MAEGRDTAPNTSAAPAINSLFDDQPNAFNMVSNAFTPQAMQDLCQLHTRLSSPIDSANNPAGRPMTARPGTSSPILARDGNDATSTTPAWTEMKTKAGKDRKRLPLACIACRRKKIRCSGEHPACKHCVRSRIPCVYKVTTRKAAPRTDYMAMLDKRLKRMEERVLKVVPKEQQNIVAITGRGTVKPTSQHQAGRGGASKKRVAEQSVADLENWVNADAQRPATVRSLHGITQDLTRQHELDEQSLLREGADKLPPRDVQEHLAEVFFDYVYGQSYHLLHKPSFMRKLSQDQIAPVLMLAICATAARFSNHPAVRTEPAFLRGEEWAAAAREISLKRYDSPNITILIVYLILTLHEFGTCQGGRSWMFGGMAQRMAYALQLHQDLRYDPKTLQSGKKVEYSFTDREIRRRTMWACFLMDRLCSSGTERPTFVSTEHIKAQLPVAERLFMREIAGRTEDLAGRVSQADESDETADPKENMGVAAFTIRIIAIWGEAISYYNLGGKQKEQYPELDHRSDFHKLMQHVKSWDEELPKRLRYNADNLATHATEKIANQFVFMHIIYHQTVLFINRFALSSAGVRPKNLEQMPTAFLKDCAQAAWSAANKVSLLVKDGMTHDVVAPFAGYAAFFSGAVHIQGTFSKNAALQTSSKQHLTFNINYLTKMKKHWGMFHFMTENLRSLYKKHADLARSNVQKRDSDAAEDGIFQYGDWFDRYPHGVRSAGFDDTGDEIGAEASLSQQGALHTVEDFFANLSPKGPEASVYDTKRKAQRRQTSKATPDGPATEPLQQHIPIQPVQLPIQPQNMYDGLGGTFADYQQAFAPPRHDMASLPYMDHQPSIDTLTGYQAELTQLANTAVGPLIGNMNAGFGAIGFPSVSVGQGPFDNGAWFMPYNLDASAIAHVPSSFGTGWPDSQFSTYISSTGLNNDPQEMHGAAHRGLL